MSYIRLLAERDETIRELRRELIQTLNRLQECTANQMKMAKQIEELIAENEKHTSSRESTQPDMGSD